MTLADSLIADVPRLSADEQAFMRELFDRVLTVGRRNYTPWQAANESRPMMRETAEELLDGCVYLAMASVMRTREIEGSRAVMARPIASFDVVDGVVSEVLR